MRRAKEDCRSEQCVVAVKEIVDAVDYSSKFTRADVDAAAPIIERMTAPLAALLARIAGGRVAGVDIGAVRSVDLFGGASRLPQLQKALAAVAKTHSLALGHRLNTELRCHIRTHAR